MGVIYKFKEEVVDFIVRQKRDNPHLSCRRLTDIVSQEFQIQVSKSSVNAILKNAQLSSPVGRRPFMEKKSRSFQIPPTKKKEIFGTGHQAKEITTPKKVFPAKPTHPVLPGQEKVVRQLVKKESVVHDPSSDLSTVEQKQKYKKESPSSLLSTQLYDGMGCIFLKGIEWSLSPTPLLGELLKDYVKGFAVEDIHAASEVLLYLQTFGMRRLEDLANYQGLGLWKLNQLSSGFDYRIVMKLYQSLTNLDELSLKISSEIGQLFTEIQYLKICCEDGQEILMGALFHSLGFDNVQSVNVCSYNKLLSNLTDQIISNRFPTIIKYAPGQTAIAKEFYDFITSYENGRGKKIVAISLIDREGQELSKFTSIPAQKRYFIIGLWPWQKEFDALLAQSVSRTQKELLHPLTQQKLSLVEITPAVVENLTRHLSPTIRGFLIYVSKHEKPVCAILTNIPLNQMSSEDIVWSYILCWPNLTKIPSPRPSKDSDVSPPKLNDDEAYMGGFWDQINRLVKRLEQSCRSQFFDQMNSNNDTTYEISTYYKLPGYWQEHKDYSLVSLVLPHQPADQPENLEYAIARFNESNIVDPSGKRLFVKSIPR